MALALAVAREACSSLDVCRYTLSEICWPLLQQFTTVLHLDLLWFVRVLEP